MLLASALFLAAVLAETPQAGAAQPQAEPAAAAPVATSDALPPGVPADDYGFVAWCRGTLSGYLELKPQVMPEVTRIEGEFQRPGTTLQDDLKVYDEVEQEGRTDLALFEKAMGDAEKASAQPISAQGVEDVAKGRATWAGSGTLPKARLAQEWMSWELPPQCETAAKRLEAKAALFGQALRSSDAAATTAPSPQ